MQPKLKVLSQNERDRVHEATLELLAKTGMRVELAQAREILQTAGAQVDHHTQRVRFPRELVERSIELAPETYTLGARRPDWRFTVNQGESTLCMSGEGTLTLDRKTGKLRDSTFQDWLEVTRLGDAADEIGIYWCTVTPTDHGDRPVDFVDYLITMCTNFSKHIQDTCSRPQQVPWLLEVLQTVYGDRETIRRTHPFSTLICPQSPLILDEQYTAAYLAMKGWKIPVAVMPMALMGATAPPSMIATLVQINSEVLGTLCLIQAAEPETPFIYAPVLTLMDPNSGRYFSGGVEQTLMNAAGIEMARYYGFPTLMGGWGSDACAPSIQAGYERAITGSLPALKWPDFYIGPGILGGDMILSFDQLLMDLEMFRMYRQMHRGIVTSEEKWMPEVIAEIGPGGYYLDHEFTAREVRSGEWYHPKLGFHDANDAWFSESRTDLLTETGAQVEQILKTHEPLPLDDHVVRELQQIRKSAEVV
jgi:trimethylamine---corrinoid protein Co-methyltransferase